MSAQRVATGIGLAALIVLLVAVGAPALVPPDLVPAIQIVDPVGNRTDDGQGSPLGGDDDDADDRTDDGVATDDSPDDDDDDAGGGDDD